MCLMCLTCLICSVCLTYLIECVMCLMNVMRVVDELGLPEKCKLYLSIRIDAVKRVPLIVDGGRSPEYEKALISLFRSFAHNEDGTASIEDIRNYIISCNAGVQNASVDRIRSILSEFPGESESDSRFGF